MSSFWEYVEVRSLEECWPWKGSTRGAGCGQCSTQHDKSRLASRAAYKSINGELPDELCVCHTCDNPACCNPSHLFAGTKKDNTQDALRKGRFVFPPRDQDAVIARVALASKYVNKEFRLSQGRKIKEGHAKRKQQEQLTVRYFAFHFGDV